MGDIQVTQEVLVELLHFYNVDLFQRGYYQVRCRVKNPPKLISVTQCDIKEVESDSSRPTNCLFKAFIDTYTSTGVSKTFEVYYKHEEVLIGDKFLFKIDMLLDGSKLEAHLPTSYELELELYFTECTRSPATPKSLENVSIQTLTINTSFGKTFHACRPVLFDYFHLGAVRLAVHSSTVAIRQPWLAPLKQLHPIWSGRTGNIRQFCYGALFGKSSNISSNQKLDNKQHANATFLHRKLCLQLLRLYESMLGFFHSAMAYLPQYAQVRISQPDVDSKLEVLNHEFETLVTAEEMYLRMGDDLYLLSTELSMLWLQFLDQFTSEQFLSAKLASEHHEARVEHFCESFFTEDHVWDDLCLPLALNSTQHAQLASTVKGSLYYELTPPVDLECALLDGDRTNMPIVFEDRYFPVQPVDEPESPYRSGSISMTVEESIVDGDFVDMDVSLEASPQTLTDVLGFDAGDVELTVGENSEKLATLHIGRPSLTELPGLLQVPENNDDEGSEFEDVSAETKRVSKKPLACKVDGTKREPEESTDTDTETNFVIEKGSVTSTASPINPRKRATKKFPKEPSAVFHVRRSADSSERASVGEDALLVDGSESDEQGSYKPLDSAHTPSPRKSDIDSRVILDPPSPSQELSGNLWSCFPAIKKGAIKKGSSYKMAFQSPPYLPVPRENLTRFQRAKQNLLLGFNFPGHYYVSMVKPPLSKPYFTERILATTENVHLIVCVHGLDGNSGDLRLVKCYLEMALPKGNFDFLMSEINQDDTFCDIDQMTGRLVDEILTHIRSSRLDIIKISFVGHSLGNVIIRNAVVHSKMMAYRSKYHTFLSLSGPHLGMQFHTSSIVSTGMWLMQKWKKEGSLVQLALNDSTNLRDTFMYRLSLTNGFQYFKNVLLVSSVQDHYVPFHSARIEMCKQVTKDSSEMSLVYKEMMDNILKPLLIQQEVNVIRYSVYHPVSSGNANTIIGRAAHIAMLDSELFLEKLILVSASKYFR